MKHLSLLPIKLQGINSWINCNARAAQRRQEPAGGIDLLPQSSKIGASHTQATDAGVEHLKGLTNLKTLDLHNTHVTDAGTKYLAEMKQLKEVWLMDTEVTGAGADKLRRALPYCAVYVVPVR